MSFCMVIVTWGGIIFVDIVAWADGRVAWAVASKTKWFGVQVPVIGFEG
jgi:hypothetical protein